MTQKDLFEWHIDKALREWDSLYKNDVMKAYENAEKEFASDCENLTLPDINSQFCLCDGRKYSETETCKECHKPLPPY